MKQVSVPVKSLSGLLPGLTNLFLVTGLTAAVLERPMCKSPCSSAGVGVGSMSGPG